MPRKKIKNKKRARRERVKRGIRKNIFGTSSKPRLTVFRSNKHSYAQLIDDIRGHTVAAASTLEEDVEGETPLEASRKVGEELARRAKEAGVEKAVFDRNGYRYHGRVKAIAEGAREGGLQF